MNRGHIALDASHGVDGGLVRIRWSSSCAAVDFEVSWLLKNRSPASRLVVGSLYPVLLGSSAAAEFADADVAHRPQLFGELAAAVAVSQCATCFLIASFAASSCGSAQCLEHFHAACAV